MADKQIYTGENHNGSHITGISDAVNGTDAVNLESMVAYVASHGGSGSGSTTYTFSAPSTTWTVNHLLGRDPAVTVIVGIDQVLADVTHSTDRNSTFINFGSPQLGKVVIS